MADELNSGGSRARSTVWRARVLGVETFDQLVAGDSSGSRINFERRRIDSCRTIRFRGEQLEPCHSPQRRLVGEVIFPIAGHVLVEAFDRGEPHRAGKFAHLGVDADFDDFALLLVRNAQPAARRGDVVVVRHDRPPSAALTNLVGGTEHFRIAEVADHLSAMAAAEGMGGVECQAKAAAIGEIFQLLDAAGVSHRRTPMIPDARGDQSFGVCRIDVVRKRVDAAEDRGRPFQLIA